MGSDSDSTVGHGDIDFGAGEVEGGRGQGRVYLATGDGVAALLVGLHGDERGVNICLVRLDPGAMHRVQSQGRGRDKLQADDDFFVSD